MEGMSDAKLAELKTAFMAIDKDQSGAISADELKEVMGMVGQSATDEQVHQMITNADTDENGKVEFAEFAKMYNKERKKHRFFVWQGKPLSVFT